jgi:hypothetical protein
MILNPFLGGIKEAGADIDLFYTWNLNIGPCNGDMSCWFKNLGQCVQKTICKCFCLNSKKLLSLSRQARFYYVGITGPLKNLKDRQLPLNVIGEQRSKKVKAVLVSTYAARKLSMFDPILMQMKAIYDHPEAN